MKPTMKIFDHSIKQLTKLAIATAVISLMACDPGQPEINSDSNVTGFAAPLSQAEFNSLTAETQYQVASKLYGTLFRGISEIGRAHV